MAFGFECDDGWYDILDTTFAAMYQEYMYAEQWLQSAQKEVDVSPSKIEELINLVNAAKQKLPIVVQVKEKWGTLRLYADNCNDYNKGLIHMAEAMSSLHCEKCGQRSITYRLGWHQTLCDEHALERFGKDAITKYKTK